MMVAQRLEHGPADMGGSSDEVFSAYDHAMIDYALRWVNHGGGPEDDIATRFEMAAREFYRAVLNVLDRDPGRVFGEFGLSPVMVTRIKAVARRRIWIAS